MADIYESLKPYLGSETYEDLVREIFHKDADLLNRLYEALTGKSSGPVDGLEIVLCVVSGLKKNSIGTFMSMMGQKE